MNPWDYAWDDCWPEQDLERSIGISDSASWLDLLALWFARPYRLTRRNPTDR